MKKFLCIVAIALGMSSAFAGDSIVLSNGQTVTLEVAAPTRITCGMVQRICTLLFDQGFGESIKPSFSLRVNEDGKIREIRTYYVGLPYADVDLARAAAESAAIALDKSAFCTFIDKH
jgi:hypothetical protein